jgi:hypothetical protein
MLHETRQAGAGHIDGGAGALGFGTIIAAIAFRIAIRVHVPVLSILAITVHGEVAP